LKGFKAEEVSPHVHVFAAFSIVSHVKSSRNRSTEHTLDDLSSRSKISLEAS
jgi:hypothetical protein